MKFSIIVPVYNAQKYLQSCCNAILGQSYQNFELILVDDGSTDHSGAVCDYIVESIPEKCVVLHTINQGPLLARQTGIRAATGDVLVFVDSDDCIREDMLKSLADSFQATDCDMILFNASDKDDYSRTFCNCPFQHFASVVDGEKKRIYYNMVYSEIPNAVCLKATKRHCFNEFPDFSGFSYVKNGEDLLMSLYMVTAAKKIVYLDENLYYYRQHEGSIVHSYNPERARSIKLVHQELERFIDLWGMPELHPAHFTREVNGWVETLLILLANKKHLDPKAFRGNLIAMAEDDYFRRAYTAMDTEKLPGTHRILAKWLYQKRFFLLRAAGLFKTIKQRTKNHQ